jgi:ribosome recycling factor
MKEEEVCVCGEHRRQYHKYSAMIFSVESERLRLMRSESNDMIKKTKETSLCFEIVYGSCCVYIET